MKASLSGGMTGGHNGGIAEGTFAEFLTDTVCALFQCFCLSHHHCNHGCIDKPHYQNLHSQVLKEAQACTKDPACPGIFST